MAKTEDEAFLLPNEEEGGSEDEEYKPVKRSLFRRSYLLWGIILISIILNIFQAVMLARTEKPIIRYLQPFSSCNHDNQESALENTHEHTHDHDLETTARVLMQPLYSPKVYEWTVNSQSTDKLFKGFDPDHGLVALPKGQPNVLPSEPFPWDSDKEVYVLSGYHSLHSLQVIWQHLHRLAAVANETLGGNLLHSLNVLWEDVLCAADSTPMSISHEYVTNRTAIIEAEQTRKCRDWRDPDESRIKNTACFKDLGAARHKTPMIEEWQFCPNDSPYKKIVDEYRSQAGQA